MLKYRNACNFFHVCNFPLQFKVVDLQDTHWVIITTTLPRVQATPWHTVLWDYQIITIRHVVPIQIPINTIYRLSYYNYHSSVLLIFADKSFTILKKNSNCKHYKTEVLGGVGGNMAPLNK